MTSKPASQTPSHTQRIYEKLRNEIISCRLSPDERLKISDLAERHSVNPGAVREALSRLTSENLVLAETPRGFRVSPISKIDLEDLTNVRIEIETQCLQRSILNASIDWESALVAASYTLNRVSEQIPTENSYLSDEWTKAHREFHSALVSACDSLWLLRIREHLYAQSERYRRLSVPIAQKERNTAEEHKLILEASLERNVDKAVQALAEHMRRTTLIILERN